MEPVILHSRALGSSLIALLIFTAVACHQPTARERLLGTRAQTPAPTSDGSCDFDLTGDKSDTVFFVLGFLDEYNGRRIVEDDDRIERFYCNEADTARLFRRYLGTLAEEQRLDPAVREETVQRCLTSYYSPSIANRLNSCYRYEMTDRVMEAGPDGTYRRTANPSLEIQLFMPGQRVLTDKQLAEDASSRRRALAFISGAWARYRRGPDFVFANARDKASLVARLLTALGCHDVHVESTVGRIPQTNTVHFEPTDEVAEWLRRSW